MLKGTSGGSLWKNVMVNEKVVPDLCIDGLMSTYGCHIFIVDSRNRHLAFLGRRIVRTSSAVINMLAYRIEIKI